ncbi:MAG: hypothetical protein KC501_05190, partial [Myxococcales bacterium]|nr:hypothetical protein [Myxococcales bacterium]
PAQPAEPSEPASAPEPTPPPVPPAAPAYQPPADPFAALLTVGNRWEHAELTGWHDELWSVGIVQQRVSSSAAVGPFTVARLEVSGETPIRARWWVRKDGVLHMLEAIDEEDAPAMGTPAEVEAALRQAAATLDLARAEPGLGCGMVGCVGSLVQASDDGGVALWPGVGIVEIGEIGPYSEETGDGTTISRHLVRAWLGEPAPALVVEAEPPAAAIARKQAREALLRKDATAHAVVRHSLGFETRTWPAFAEVLAERGPAAWSLGAVLEHECALVRGPIDVLSCPAAHAEWSTEVVQGRAPTTTEARAYFLPHGEGFELVAVLAGGRADVFTTDDEGRSIPARKWPKP